MKLISIVVPVYNSEHSLKELARSIQEAFANSSTYNYELILVDDGSKDKSWEMITKLCNENQTVRGIGLMRNFGQHNALLTGIKSAAGEFIITMDDDLQHPPDQIPRLIEKINEGYDVVYGTASTDKHELWRNLSSKLIKQILRRMMGISNAQELSPFRAFRSEVRESFAHYNSPHVVIDVLLSWGANKFASVKIEYQERKYGRSNYTFVKLLRHAVNMIIGFSVFPLRIASFTGFFFTLFGFGVLIYVLIIYLINRGAVPGFSFLASAIAIFSGVQLFSLGIIGEYLARIYSQSLQRPYSVIRQTIGFPEK